MSTALTSPCAITVGGDYYLANPITVNGGVAFTVQATGVRINLNGMTIADASTGNGYSAAFSASNGSYTNLAVFGGAITGFRVGVDSNMPYTRVQEVDLSGNKYIGANLSGAVSRSILCVANGIGGVSDEAYAIAVNMGGAGGFIQGGDFRNIYRQAGAAGSLVGEGCPIVAQGAGITIEKNFIQNDTVADKTIAVFTGAAGGAVVRMNQMYGFKLGVQDALAGGSISVTQNAIRLAAEISGSKAIWGELGAASDNVIAGYETAISGGITDGGNLVC